MRKEQQDFPAGTLRLNLEDRTGDGSGGPAIRVYGPTTDGQAAKQLLRFDCFRDDAHYHFDPEGRDEVSSLQGPDAADSVAWSLRQLRENLPEMVRRAGGSEEAVQAAASQATRTAISEVAAALGRGS